ncbi:hypothetical protein [Streptomyces sp. NPDC048825]|uniref:alpha-L-rhamnosidase-related protein n=1 Tax=Streptomyces sp. NPDC048825 TaxID=3365592 RepID=UPI003720D67D
MDFTIETRHRRGCGQLPGTKDQRLRLGDGRLRTGFARTGTFTTDNALLNRLQRNMEWVEQSNLVQKPTDTPSREKKRRPPHRTELSPSARCGFGRLDGPRWPSARDEVGAVSSCPFGGCAGGCPS